MATLEFVEPVSEDYFDVLVEVGFEETLTAKETTHALRIILDAAASNLASTLFEGMSYLELTDTNLKIVFRFHSRDGRPLEANKTEEEMSRLKMQFIFYLFAKIDLQFKLADVPFPPDFRAFLSLPEYLNTDK